MALADRIEPTPVRLQTEYSPTFVPTEETPQTGKLPKQVASFRFDYTGRLVTRDEPQTGIVVVLFANPVQCGAIEKYRLAFALDPVSALAKEVISEKEEGGFDLHPNHRSFLERLRIRVTVPGIGLRPQPKRHIVGLDVPGLETSGTGINDQFWYPGVKRTQISPETSDHFLNINPKVHPLDTLSVRFIPISPPGKPAQGKRDRFVVPTVTEPLRIDWLHDKVVIYSRPGEEEGLLGVTDIQLDKNTVVSLSGPLEGGESQLLGTGAKFNQIVVRRDDQVLGEIQVEQPQNLGPNGYRFTQDGQDLGIGSGTVDLLVANGLLGANIGTTGEVPQILISVIQMIADGPKSNPGAKTPLLSWAEELAQIRVAPTSEGNPPDPKIAAMIRWLEGS